MLRNLFCIFFAAFWTAFLFPFTLVAMVFTWNTDSALWICRHWWGPGLLWAGGAKLEVIGAENADPRRPTIYASNHQSTIDIPALFTAIPVDLRFVCKKELKYVPFIGWYLTLGKHVFVDRKNRSQSIASMEEAGRRIRSGINIIIYPEGTRSPDGRILPFKRGAFAVALKARVPICPVTVELSGKLMPKSSWNITPGPIRVKIGPPIDTTKFAEDDREGLARVVRNAIIQQSLELGGVGGDLEYAPPPSLNPAQELA